MNLQDRIGFDAGATKVEDALRWAIENGFHYVDFNADHGPNHFLMWSEERVHPESTARALSCLGTPWAGQLDTCTSYGR